MLPSVETIQNRIPRVTMKSAKTILLALDAVLPLPAVAAKKIYLVDISGSIQMVATGRPKKDRAYQQPANQDARRRSFEIHRGNLDERRSTQSRCGGQDREPQRSPVHLRIRQSRHRHHRERHQDRSWGSLWQLDCERRFDPSGSGLYTAKPAAAPNAFKGTVQLSTAFASFAPIVGPASILNIQFKTNGTVLNNVVVP